MDLSNLIKSLENGVCPTELLYKPNPETDEFDWNRVLYNLRYHNPEFYDNKFPPEIKQIPAYDKIIDLIVQKNEDYSIRYFITWIVLRVLLANVINFPAKKELAFIQLMLVTLYLLTINRSPLHPSRVTQAIFSSNACSQVFAMLYWLSPKIGKR